MKDKDAKLLPFVKWVGGKRNIIKKHLDGLLPKEFNEYYEPFVGGGSMFLHLRPKKCYINDINNELITTYNTVKYNPEKLMKKLDEMKSQHSKEFYYKVRSWKPNNELDTSAKFIYLNKTCFNGVYRVNSKGDFNVPFNGISKEKLNLYDKENILSIHNYMNSSDFKAFNEDYIEFLKKPKKGDFVFVDSPYDYEVGVKGFDSYNKSSFGQKNQIFLADELKKLDEKGVKFMATNHSTNLIRKLYKDFKIIEINTDRFVNSDPTNRKQAAKEVIIMNYEE